VVGWRGWWKCGMMGKMGELRKRKNVRIGYCVFVALVFQWGCKWLEKYIDDAWVERKEDY
jgi:hypothetical protein